jgi:hypothetical protein
MRNKMHRAHPGRSCRNARNRWIADRVAGARCTRTPGRAQQRSGATMRGREQHPAAAAGCCSPPLPYRAGNRGCREVVYGRGGRGVRARGRTADRSRCVRDARPQGRDPGAHGQQQYRCPGAEGARRRWAQLYRALRRAQPDPERSGGARPNCSAKVRKCESAKVRECESARVRKCESARYQVPSTQCPLPGEPRRRKKPPPRDQPERGQTTKRKRAGQCDGPAFSPPAPAGARARARGRPRRRAA